MVANNQIILDQILNQRQLEIDPDASASSFFEFFTAEQVLKDLDLSFDEIDSGLMGGAADGGIDALYILLNGDLVQEDSDHSHIKRDITIDLIIVQSKTSSGFQETPIERFITVSNDLFDLSTDVTSLAGVYNERLVETIRRFQDLYQEFAVRFPTLSVSFYYACKGADPHENVQRKSDMLKDAVHAYFPDAQVNFRFLGAAELLALARRRPQRRYNLPLAENPISSEYQVGFVCLVKLSDFYEFITDDNKAMRKYIFEANVRDYQGRTQVNDEIQRTLKNALSEDFWWLNNGVSILASQPSLGGKTLTIEDPRIVNGLQTSTEIYNHCKEIGPDNRRNVLVRVMVPTEEASGDRIIKATNSQTVVQAASLRATDKIHRDIEEYLRSRGLFYDRRKNYYKNEGKPRDKIVSIGHLAQTVMALVLQRPDTARARPSSLLKTEETYREVFDPNYPIQMYYVCAEAMRRVESYLKLPTLNISAKDRNNLRFYVGMYTVPGGRANKQDVVDRVANFDVHELDDTSIQLSLDLIQNEYLALGGDDKVAKGRSLLEAILAHMER